MDPREWHPGDSRVLPEVPESAYPPDAVALAPPRQATLAEVVEQLNRIERRLS